MKENKQAVLFVILGVLLLLIPILLQAFVTGPTLKTEEFQHKGFGDRWSRRETFAFSLVLMIAATGGVLLLAHNWADWPATKRSYELMARYVHPHFQCNANELRDWSYVDAKSKYETAGVQSRAAVQAAIDKHQGRKG